MRERRFKPLIALVVVLGLAGCGGTAHPQADVTSFTPLATSMSEAPPTATDEPPTTTEEAAAADASCGVMFFDGTPFALGRSWDLVTASRGASDHQKRVEGFAEAVDDVFDDVDDEPSTEAKAACGVRELAQLNYEVALLNARVGVSGEAEEDAYKSVADAANAWIEKVGAEGEVEPFTTTYKG